MKGDVNMRYIGSKLNLLTEIQEFLSQNIQSDNKIFLDLFGGSNIVGSYFKKDYQILTNDLLYFSYAIAQGKIVNNEQPQFLELKKRNIENPLDYLNNSTNFSDYIGYYEKEYSPTGEAMYFSVENAKRIDFIRDEIDSWKEQDLLSESEYFYLLASLLEAIPFVSNTTGTYGAFLKKWDKRALKKLELLPLDLTNNKQHNQAFNENSNELVKKISADITYIDTPYNKRQYAPNYHVLENIARNDKPELSGKTRLFDYKKLKSDYSNAKLALDAMENLIKNLDTTHIILSYNNEGIIPETDLIGLLKKYTIDGNINIKKIPYRKYKSKNPSDSYDLYELLIYIQKKKVLENKKIRIHSKKQVLLPKYVKSPLNYIGGKYKLLPQILPLFPDNIDTFVDLFSGGANVGINVQANHHIFNDMNNRMNEMFRYFATENPQEIIIKIKNRISEYQLSKENEQAYLNFRRKYNENPNPLDLYVLVSYSYNYQFRFNNSMEFNNPFGRNRSCFSENMEQNLFNFLSRLQTMDSIFTDNYFTDVDLSGMKKDDFVYLDPPYLITTGSYNDGNRGFSNWTEYQEYEMYELLSQLTKQGVRYALSNVVEHKGKTNKILSDFIDSQNVHTHYLNFNYNNSSHNSKARGSQEILLTNYDPETFEVLRSEQIFESQQALLF